MLFMLIILILAYQSNCVLSFCNCQFEEKGADFKYAICSNVTAVLFCDGLWNGTKSLKIIEPNMLDRLSPILAAFEDHASQIQFLDLSANNVTKANLNAFHNFKHLQSLNLSHNTNICFVPNNDPRYNLKYLKKIILEHNNMTSISSDFFENLASIRYLDLSFNKIKNIKGPFTSIHTLLLKNNNLTVLTSNFFQNISFLNQLNLQWNNLVDIHPDAFKCFLYLENLDLSNNKLYSVSYQTFNSLPLSFLDLSHNQIIKELDYRLFQNITNLQHLNLSYNHITSFHQKSFYLSQDLIYLDLSHNKIKEFQTQFFQFLPALKKLSINDNQIKYLYIDNLMNFSTSLEKIYLDNNVWDCVNLTQILSKSQQRRVAVPVGTNYSFTNVVGIACLNYTLEDFNAILVDKIGVTIVRIEIFIIILIVCVILGALYTIFYQLYANYRGRTQQEGVELLQTS